MEQISPRKVKVTYMVLSKPVGIPKIFADPFIRSNFMTIIPGLYCLDGKDGTSGKNKVVPATLQAQACLR